MVHYVEWNYEKVGSFWKVNHSLFSRRRFSQQVGRALEQVIFSEGARRGASILDFGCGDGALLKRLVDHQSLLVGTDFEKPDSLIDWPTSGEHAPRDSAYFASPLRLRNAQGAFDLAMLIEVVEHLDDKNLGEALDICAAALKPGGKLLITTPHAENLLDNTVNCPDCGCVFHRVQHVRSWQPDTLAAHMRNAGFTPCKVFVTDLGRMQRSWASRIVHTVVDRLDGRKMPHLIGVFEKK